MKGKLRTVGCTALLLAVTGCDAQPEVPLPLTECAGRLEFGMPGPIEVGASPAKFYRDSNRILLPSQFANGDPVFGLGRDLYASGHFRVSHPLAAAERAASAGPIGRFAKNELAEFKARLATKQGRQTLAPFVQPARPLRHRPGHSWGQADHHVVTFVGEHAVEWNAERDAETDAMFEALDRDARPRSLGEAPQEPGVCLPYVFIPIREPVRSSVEVYYRLLDHPDVEVDLVHFARARELEPQQTLEKQLELEVTRRWHDMYGIAKKLRPIDEGMTGLAGGTAYFRSVEFVRYGGEVVDYGYLVVGFGDPAMPHDKPSMRLQVRRHAARAEKLGKEPMPKEQFFALARAIHASVKLRAWGGAGLAAVEKTATTPAP